MTVSSRFTGFPLSLLVVVFVCTPLAPAQSTLQAPVPATTRERLALDRGWLFHEGDIPFPVITGHQASYDNAKAGSSSGAAAPDL